MSIKKFSVHGKRYICEYFQELTEQGITIRATFKPPVPAKTGTVEQLFISANPNQDFWPQIMAHFKGCSSSSSTQTTVEATNGQS